MTNETTSDTPETDALYKNDHRPNLMEHARKLERERDEARKWNAEGKINGARCAEERDRLQDAIRNMRDVQGRYHTQIATERLFALLPENASVEARQ